MKCISTLLLLITVIFSCSAQKDPPLQHNLDNKLVTIKTSSGYYLEAIDEGSHPLVANSKRLCENSYFTIELVDPGNNLIRLRIGNKLYLCAEAPDKDTGYGSLEARHIKPSYSEIFKVEWIDSTKNIIRLRTRNDHYLHAVRGGGYDVDARDLHPEGYSEFEIVFH